jgi:hypothetical protein
VAFACSELKLSLSFGSAQDERALVNIFLSLLISFFMFNKLKNGFSIFRGIHIALLLLLLQSCSKEEYFTPSSTASLSTQTSSKRGAFIQQAVSPDEIRAYLVTQYGPEAGQNIIDRIDWDRVTVTAMGGEEDGGTGTYLPLSRSDCGGLDEIGSGIGLILLQLTQVTPAKMQTISEIWSIVDCKRQCLQD